MEANVHAHPTVPAYAFVPTAHTAPSVPSPARRRWLRHHLGMAAAVAAGGAVGGLARYALIQTFPYAPGDVPYVILAVNIGGAFALGAVGRWLVHAHPAWRRLRYALTTGCLGALTTFSTYALDAVWLTRAARPLAAAGYVAASLIAGVLAATAGLAFAHRLLLRASS